jgi:hypothetical protein
MGGLGWYGSEGLPYGKLGFSSNGRWVSAEKASLRESICAWISGMGQAEEHFSKMRMWRVKYSRASELNSGSGEVIAICCGQTVLSINTILPLRAVSLPSEAWYK